MNRMQSAYQTFVAILLVVALATPPVRTIATPAAETASREYFAEFPLGVIGVIEASGAVTLDGRLARSAEALRGGELIQAAPGSSARVSFPSLGQITLGSNAMARVTSVRAGEEQGLTQRVLIASLISGEMAVQMEGGAGSYIQAGSTALMALDGASLQLNVRNGNAVISRVSGFVESLGTWTVAIPSEILQATGTMLRATPGDAPRDTLTAQLVKSPVNQEAQPMRFSMAALGQITLSSQVVRSGHPKSETLGPPVIRGTMSGREIMLASAHTGLGSEKERWSLQLPSSVVAAATAVRNGTPGIRAAHRLRPLGFSSAIFTRGGESQPIQVRVTDVKDQPVANVPVLFHLGKASAQGDSIGTLRAEGQIGSRVLTVTNEQGIATASFVGDNFTASATLSVYVDGVSEDENLRWDSALNVERVNASKYKDKSSENSGKKKAILLFAAAAAATGLAIALSRRGGQSATAPLPQPLPLPVPTPTPTQPTTPIGGPVICPFAKC